MPDVNLSAFVAGRSEQNGATDHIALLRTATAESSTRIKNWVCSARARGDHVVTVAVDGFTPGTEGLPALAPVELHPDGRPAEVVGRALDAGHRGLGVLVHADAVIAAMSATVHPRSRTCSPHCAATTRCRCSASTTATAPDVTISTWPRHAIPTEAPAALSINVSGVGFLSVAAARTLALNGAGYGQHGGRVELRGAPTHVQNVLSLFLPHDGDP